MINLIKITILFCALINVESANILGIFPMPSRSHHILGSTLLKALAEKGHNVTMISSFPFKNKIKNYEDIALTSSALKPNKETMLNIIKPKGTSYIDNLVALAQHVNAFRRGFYEDQAVKRFLASNRTYDLVIQCWTMNPSHLGIAHHFGASSIIFSTVGSTVLMNSLTGNPSPYSYVPNIFLHFSQNMTFIQRVFNTLANWTFEIFYSIYTYYDEQLLKEQFPNAPSLNELYANISLVLLNSHYSIESPRPYQPNMIQIGGFHVEDGKGLTNELQDFMDSATEGVIFFSLGSNMKSAYLPDETLQAIVNTFAKLPVKVLWKFEDDNIPNISSNVKIGKWLPQRDILAHPNLKAFITHGGLLSTTEAVYNGVPMVGIPLFGDQQSNVFEAVSGGYAIKLDLLELTEESLTGSIKEILNNPSYRNTIQRRSKIMKDQPVKPLTNAIYWVEYVLRHKGAHHLQAHAMRLKWYQHNLIDVFLFLGAIFITSTIIGIYIFMKIIQIVKARLCKEKSSGSKQTKQTKTKKKTKQA